MEPRATEDIQGDTPPEVEKSMTKSHLKLVLFCLAVVCFALLLGGGAVYTSAIPTPRLSLANRWCDAPSNGTYSYFTPFDWAEKACDEATAHESRMVRAAVAELSPFLSCRVCSSCNETSCASPSLALAADSGQVLAMMVAATCSSLADLSTKDAMNATLFASTLGHWSHDLPPRVVSASILGMLGYNTTGLCPKLPNNLL